MAKTLTTRLDQESSTELIRLSKILGKTQSEIVRESIHLMATTCGSVTGGIPRFIGLGNFASGKPDLASNKKHLKGFGK